MDDLHKKTWKISIRGIEYIAVINYDWTHEQMLGALVELRTLDGKVVWKRK